MLKKNNLSLFLTVGAAALLVGAGVSIYLALLQRNTSQVNAPAGAELVPQDALLAVSISTDSSQWQQLRQYGTPETQAMLDAQIAHLRDTFLTANGYNYQQDIQPWLGKEVMIAFLSSQTPQTPSSAPLATPAIVMVLPIDNPIQAQKLLEKPKSSKAPTFIERTYKGIQIRETKTAALSTKEISNPISTTVLGRSLIVTTNSRATDRVIDTYKSTVSLASTPGYTQALSKIKSGQNFAQMYLNIPMTTAWAAANSARSLSSQNLAQVQQQQGITTLVTLEDSGIYFQGVSWLKPNSEKKNFVENNAKIMPKLLPSTTLMMISGGNLQHLWEDYTQGSQSNPITPSLFNPANLKQGIKSTLDLDLEPDLLSWMKGEFSLSLIPAQATNPSNFGAGILFMVQTNDRSLADKTLKKIDDLMTKKYQFQVQETKLNGKEITNWVSSLGGVTASHGWLDGNVAFLTVGANITNSIIPKPPKTLLENPLYQQSTPPEEKSNNGQFFMDIEHTINAGNLDLAKFLPISKSLINGIKGMGVTSNIQDDRNSLFDIFVILKKVTDPLPTPRPSPPAKPSLSPKPKTSTKSPPSTAKKSKETSKSFIDSPTPKSSP